MRIHVPFQKLQHVVHLADIHIRLFRRHEEYEAVFEQLYADITAKNLRDFVIVLAGDIVHAKTDMSPEMVQVTSKFLARLADIAPTILIAGNHDCNLANTSRLDALTPIVENLGHSNLHYIRNSAVVGVADTAFAVMSIFDEQDHWPTAAEIDEEYTTKVALYHGPVYGATTDTNYTITDRHVSVDTFKGFDIVMLGDIHKPNQVLHEKNPIVVYPGSLIQQNFGESCGNHGWCLWNISNSTYEFVPTYNAYGYVTLEVIDGHIQYPPQMPDKTRLRLFTGDLDATDVKKLVTVLRNKFSIIEMSVNKSRHTKQSVDTTAIQYDTLDLTDITTQNNYIIDWLTLQNPAIDQVTIDNITRINKDLNGKITHEDHSRNIHWKPLKFTFSNMFSYGENNEIDFTDMHGLYGIFAANASGKSSIADSLMFCLYDKTPRAFKGDHIINNRKDVFECELLFDINGEHFGIRRIGTRRKNGDVKVDVTFWKVLDTGERLNLNGEDRRDTNANIRSYVGTYEDFIMTALSSQSSNALFIDKSHSERKDLLIQFMGLNVFDKLYDTAKDEAKEIVGILKRFKKSDVAEQLSDTQREIVRHTDTLNGIAADYSFQQDKLQAIESAYTQKLEERRPVEITENITVLKTQLAKVTDQIDKLVTEKERLTHTYQSEVQQLTNLQQEVQTYDVPGLQVSVATLTEVRKQHADIRAECKLISATLSDKQAFLEKLSTYKYNPNCSVCVENNRSVVDDVQVTTDAIQTLSAQLAAHEHTADIAHATIESLGPAQQQYEQYTTLLHTITDLDRRVQQMQLDIAKKETAISAETLAKDEISRKIELYQLNESSIRHNEEVDMQLHDLKTALDEKRGLLSTYDKQLQTIRVALGVAEAKKVELVTQLKSIEEYEALYDAYTLYLSAVGRDGVPYALISKIIPHIEGEINNILSQIVDFSVSLEVDGKNINGRITYDNERIWPLENSSGMERFISGLAIRVALMNISNLPKANFLILDEGFGALDAEHIHSMQTLFNLLKTHFDFIFIVSHLDAMRDMVDTLIEIRKEDGYSHISI
jgi:DNA repair exonuclease SbcCD ATPase subunit/DNA repair exonuclease SbcCD nuclease subunit